MPNDPNNARSYEAWMNETAADDSLEFALEEAKEGVEILDNLIDSVTKHGNYSKDATLLFLSHARQCFNALQRLAPNAQVTGLSVSEGPVD